eukprot:CAMPEP_0201570140 /NCGR_PEP_ID=MMETSP0190_2-20130828/12253_1 /ASSEMBLY_ACC=CAM_ASM_000263 /TAXON_ID=37353 /ORGANISM="Rosalina sp." /LENGTH=485 /DNA_ID=CAMNT_0047993349 /DNA_START=103 /DNA_END=1560 /DNA_ORIENTATION=+
MDELGSAPRIQFGDNDQYTTDADQNGSWFGLAMSGLKFLINNQHNNNINHNLNPPQSSSNMNNPNVSSSTSSNANSAKNQNLGSTKKVTETSQKPKKLHILGPSVFKKQLYDIPEYQSTSDNNKRGKGGKGGSKRSIRTTSKLTKQALAQFNGNFTNYWNQRSSLHSHYGSSNGDHADDDMTSNAGSRHTNDTNNAKTATLTDGGSSTMHHHTEEHNPSMTSSQIIHPTQDKPPKLSHSRSFPLLHSAEYIQDFQKFTFTEDKDIDIDQEGIMNIPSPPPVSSTPDINSSILLPKIKNVHAVKSWESVHSSNIGSVKSFPDDNSEHQMQAFTDGKLLTSGPGQINHSLTQLIVSDDHFIKEKQQSAIAQKQWLRKNLSAMKSKRNHGSIDSSFSGGSTNTNNTGLVHIHQDHGSKTQSELDWTECNDTIIGQVISRPIPQSIKKNKNKSKKKRKKSKDKNNNGNDSDWSNVSSNMGVTTPTTTQQ